MKVSIRGVIITGFIVLIWGTLLISTPFSYISNKKVMMVHTMDILSCIATAIGLYVGRKIITPISELDREARLITENDYSPRKKINTAFIEIQRTADTFEKMKSAVIAYKNRLKKEERIHRTITETANDAIVMLDANNRVTYWNTAAGGIFGYTGHDALGKNIYELTPFGDPPS